MQLSSTAQSKVLLAQVGAPHGIQGEVRVKPFGDPEMLDQYGKLETAAGEKLKITRMRAQKTMLIVKFQNVNSREDAEKLRNENLFVDREKLPEPDEEEFYIADLIGMQVVNDTGQVIGTIKDVPNFGADDLLEIEPSSGAATYYLPFTQDVVPEINFERGQVIIHPPKETSERDEEEA